jgi:hypothetical protein
MICRIVVLTPIDYMGTPYDEAPTEDARLQAQLHQERPGVLYDLVGLAEKSVVWRNDLRKLGIPEKVWEPLIGEYENLWFKHRGESELDGQTNKIAAALNKYKQQSDTSLPTFIVGDCAAGAGAVDVRIELQPPEGQIYLIPVFLYKLCEAQHLDPADPRSCDRWTEVIHGTASYVSGDYVYLARWADGSVRCGPLGFNSPDLEGKTLQITKLRSPKCTPGW